MDKLKNKIDRIHELVPLAGQRDDLAFSELFSYFLPLIKSVQQKYNLHGFDNDDWLQEGRIACFKACQNFCSSLGSSFPSYFKLIMNRRAISLLREQESYKRKANKNNIYLDDEINSDKYDHLKTSKSQNSIEPVIFLPKMLESFSDQELEYLRYYMDHRVSKPRNRKHLDIRIKKIFRNFIHENY